MAVVTPERHAGRQVRAFIAVPLSEPLRTALASLQRELRPHLPGVRWVHPATSHLTLVFLGNLAEESLETIKAIMLSVCVDAAPFAVGVSGLGTFPSWRRPRVLWAGLADASALQRLQGALAAGLAAHGFPQEPRPFRPHLTLGRWPAVMPPPPLPERLLAADLGRIEVTRIVLFESRLNPAGAVHIPLQSVLLGRNGGAVGPASPGGV